MRFCNTSGFGVGISFWLRHFLIIAVYPKFISLRAKNVFRDRMTERLFSLPSVQSQYTLWSCQNACGALSPG